MLVYICCSGGATSSLFCQKIGQAAIGEKTFVDHIFIVLQDLENLLNSYDMILAYGPAEILNERSIKKYHLETVLDSVWVSPQVRYLQDAIYKSLEPYNIPVHLVDMRAFGTMDGKKALADIKANL